MSDVPASKRKIDISNLDDSWTRLPDKVTSFNGIERDMCVASLDLSGGVFPGAPFADYHDLVGLLIVLDNGDVLLIGDINSLGSYCECTSDYGHRCDTCDKIPKPIAYKRIIHFED